MRSRFPEKSYLHLIWAAVLCWSLVAPISGLGQVALAQDGDTEEATEETTDSGPFGDLDAGDENTDVSAFGDLDTGEEAQGTPEADQSTATAEEASGDENQESTAGTEEVDYSGRATVASPDALGSGVSGLTGVEQYNPFPEENAGDSAEESEGEAAPEVDYSPKVAFADPVTGQVPEPETSSEEEEATPAAAESLAAPSSEEEADEEEDFSTDPFGDLEGADEGADEESEEDYSTDPFGDLGEEEADSEDASEDEDDGPFSDLD